MVLVGQHIQIELQIKNWNTYSKNGTYLFMNVLGQTVFLLNTFLTRSLVVFTNDQLVQLRLKQEMKNN